MAKIHSVRMLIGANAYAVISHDDSCQTDIRLSPGKSAQASLREYARDLRADIAKKIALAELACAAADHLDLEKQRAALRERIAAGNEPITNKES